VPVVARQTYEAWLPEERDSNVMRKVTATSVIESVARRLPMTTNEKSFPRSGTMDVDVIPKGTAYGEDVSDVSEVVLVAKKFGRAVRIAEEDIDDSVINLIEDKKIAWADAYARKIDNAALGTSAAVGVGVPFTSVYRAVTTADATTGYVANANHSSVTDAELAAANTGYDALSEFLEGVEAGDYYEEGALLFIAHPSWKARFRGLKNANGDPLFIDDMKQAQGRTLFGASIRFTVGAKVSATATATPVAGGPAGVKGTAGNPLLIACNPQHLMLGVRSGPESVVIDGRDGASALTDETLLKIRARRAFTPSYPQAFAVLERVTA
jgi:HK97 family phage major capsid protein